MTRTKVKLAWISDQSTKRTTFKKRSENLINKLNELSTLTGADACGIVLSPFQGDLPLFWPPSINEILNRYFSLTEMDQHKRMVNVRSFILDQISKLEEKHRKVRKDVKEREVGYTLHSIHSHGNKVVESLSCDEASELFWFMEQLKIKCELRINNLKPNPIRQVGRTGYDDGPNDPWLARNNEYCRDIDGLGGMAFGDLTRVASNSVICCPQVHDDHGLGNHDNPHG